MGTTGVSLGCLVNKVTLPMSFHALSLFVLINPKLSSFVLFSKLSLLNKKSLSATSVYPVIHMYLTLIGNPKF